jgi:hypothetical protein
MDKSASVMFSEALVTNIIRLCFKCLPGANTQANYTCLVDSDEDEKFYTINYKWLVL